MDEALWIVAVATAAALALLAFLRARKIETVYPWEAALLYVNGTFVRQLPVGRHVLRTLGRTVVVHRAPLWDMPHPLGVIDVLTSDRFSLRISPTATVRVTDPRKAVEGQFQHLQKLKLAVAEALASETSKRTLETLLIERAELGPFVLAAVGGQFEELTVTALFITSIQLPPETRRLTTEVERARLEGQAALERSRAEHASLRALANAARLVKDNPDLLRLRTLQTVAQAGKGATIVLGQDAVTPIRRPSTKG